MEEHLVLPKPKIKESPFNQEALSLSVTHPRPFTCARSAQQSCGPSSRPGPTADGLSLGAAALARAQLGTNYTSGWRQTKLDRSDL